MALWLLLYFVIGLAGTWVARRYAIRRELIDHPGERRSHDMPTPRGGGISIVLALLIAACVIGWRDPRHIVLVAAFVAGLLLVSGVGLLDDHRPLSPWLRLGVQALASMLVALAAAGTWGSVPLALLAFVATMALTNIWNFMDGINGLAVSQAALVALGLAFVSASWGWLALALVAACLGFLPFNFPRARIFLGDVGSGALGFALAVLLVIATAGASFPPVLLLMPLAAFVVDSSLTLARRMLRGERWWMPHAQHAYQRWAAGAGTHTIVTLVYAGWTAIGWLCVWWLTRAPALATVGCASWLALSVAAWACVQYLLSTDRKSRTAAIRKDGR
ncbi:glycosyltransferase family 4 protein [Lysobacter yangpyeongensis]|uniref:Glycosyltransferase family 4 protein n=1 Tax=Lysobacter yangpyeongensis TaxID=346182 RepID=A0ABW0SJ28_9GAMM